MKVICNCGCGQEVYQNLKAHKSRRANYILGHWVKKYPKIDEWIKNNQNKHLCICGCGNYIKIKRVHYSIGIPKYIHYHNKPIGFKGKKHKKESIEKIKISCIGGNKTSFKKGHKTWSKGIERPDIKEAKNPNWKGGKSYQGYNRSEFNQKLKIKISKRDDYQCQICHKKRDLFIPLDVHHIDEDKKNNELENLITLCHICHSKLHNNFLFREEYHQNLHI
jgi:hypothetical protein